MYKEYRLKKVIDKLKIIYALIGYKDLLFFKKRFRSEVLFR